MKGDAVKKKDGETLFYVKTKAPRFLKKNAYLRRYESAGVTPRFHHYYN